MITTKEVDPIEAIDRAYVEGIDTWEALVALGASDEEEMGVRRWRHGDLAMRVEKHYGEDMLSKYADVIGVQTPTLKQRRQMSAFYEPYTRVAFSNLFYSHYREAIRYGNLETAMRALDKASLRTWPVWKLKRFVDRCLSKAKPVPPMEGEITKRYQQEDGNYAVVRLGADYPLQTGQIVTLKAKQEA